MTEENRAKDQAQSQAESIREMVAKVREAVEKEDSKAEKDAREAIQDDPLEILVRGDWHNPCIPGEGAEKPDEFSILLCTGGPAVRIVGELDEYLRPAKAWLEFQDWGISWEKWHDEPMGFSDDLLEYCGEFWFGE